MNYRTLVLVVLLALPAFANAHHSHASLNRDDLRTMTGVVSKYMWRSPHVYLQVHALRSDGEIALYTIEMGNPMSMGRGGWNKDTLQPGDRITWFGAHDRDPQRAYMGLTWFEDEAGNRTYASALEQKQYLDEKGLAIPDALSEQAMPEPATAIGEGTWSRIAADGGRFKNIYTPELIRDWPLTAAAKIKIDNFSETDNPINQCIFNGPPRATFTLSNFQWSRTADAIVIDRDLWPEVRVIHFDKNAPPGPRSRLGHSVGWFEGDELHVATNNFAGEAWAIFWGLDSSDDLAMQERYWLSDGGMRLNVEMTITDPAMLTEPVTATHQWQKVADVELIKADCSTDNANFFLTAGYE